jgi:predicted acyltransferase (DUF342 family)
MAQIIKHRRGQLSGVKSLTARNAEFIIASGSISDLNGPFVFIGSPNSTDEGVAGAFKSVSTIYQGTTAPTITAGSYGSILDGTPFYASGNESLYILNNDGAGGNTRLDLTGNIEGNLISGVTINNITGTTANIKNISGSFTGSGIGLYDIPASGITGLELNRISDGSATASISQANGLRINTNTEVTGTFTVYGNTFTSGNVNITGNTSQTGSIDLTGNIVLGGNITIGDQTTDIIQFGGEVSSSITPIVHNAFDLGSSNKNWRNLHVSGTAYVKTLEAQQVNFNDLGILTDLTVSGNTYLGNGGDITIVSGSLYNDQLTNNRVVIAGVRGVLEDDANFTFDGTKLNIGAGDFEVDVLSGDTRLSGSLTVKNNIELTGSLFATKIEGTGSLYLQPDQNDGRLFEIYNSAGPSGYTDIHLVGNADLNFFGDDTNYLKIDDNAQTVSIVGVNGVFVSSSLTVTGSFNLKDSATNFSIVGNGFSQTYFQGNGALVWNPGYGGMEVVGTDAHLKVNDYLLVGNGAGITGSLGVTDSVYITNNLSVSGSATLGDMSSDNTIVSGTLYTHNTTYLGDMNTVMGDALIVSGGVKVRGSQLISDDLIVSGNVSFGDMSTDTTIVSGTLYTHNTTYLGDMNTVMGDALIVSGAMRLRGDEILNGNLFVSGNATYGQSSGDTITLTSSLYTHNTSYIGDMNTVMGDALIVSGAIKQKGNQNVDGNISITGSLDTSGSLNVSGNSSVSGTFTVGSGSMTSLGGDLYVSGNLQVLGSSTNVNIESHTVNIGDNIISLNAYSPFQRYAGIEVIDSGSTGVSASMVWDSQNDYWMFVSASGQSSKFVGTTAGPYGSETNLTSGTFPIASASNTIGDSLLTYSGTTLAFNTNKFTINSLNGDTMVYGNFTLSYTGGTDNGSKTSAILFRNSSNVVGFVTTAETTDVMDGILGYKSSGGGLVFSTVIDGGTY